MALSKFGAAFAAARKAGKATFTFGGKAYTTKLREEVNSSTPTPPPKPKAPVSLPPSNTTVTAADTMPKKDEWVSTATAPVRDTPSAPRQNVNPLGRANPVVPRTPLKTSEAKPNVNPMGRANAKPKKKKPTYFTGGGF